MKITDERINELVELDRVTKIAYSYVWKVFRNQMPLMNHREKFDMECLKNYFKWYCTSHRGKFDEKLERWLTLEDKKQIHYIIRKRLESLITGQEELDMWEVQE